MVIKKYDPLKAGMRPLLAKTLQNALSHRIAKEFPRIPPDLVFILFGVFFFNPARCR